MNYLRTHGLLLGLAALLLLLLLAAAGYVVGKHRWAAERIDEVTPRYARVLGLQGAADQLETLAGRQAQALGRYAYPSTQDASQAGNDAMQRVRDVLADKGLQVLSSQVLAARDDDVPHFQRIPVSVRLEGDLAQIQAALAALAGLAPAIFVDSMALQVNNVPRPGPMPALACTLTLSVLRGDGT